MQANSYSGVAGPALKRPEDMIWVGDIPQLGARLHPERRAIVFPDGSREITYAELKRQSDAFVAAMRERGLRDGDRIAYLGRNNDLFFAVLFGAIAGRYVLVPLNWRLAAPEVAYQIQDSGARLVLHDQDLRPIILQASAILGSTIPALGIEGRGQEPSLRGIVASAAPSLEAPHDLEQPILQLYTSGTTGKAKGVLISHGALSISRMAELQSPDFSHVQQGCITLSAMPNFHVGGMSWVLIGLVRLGTVVITADPSPDNLLKLIRMQKVEHTWVVPTLLRAIVETLHKDASPAPKMSGIFYGAMPMDESLLRDSMALFGCGFLQFFGMTENAGSATSLGPADHDLARPHLLRSVGKPYPGMAIEIRGTDRRALARNLHGEIWVKSPTLMQGYWNLPDQTREAIVDGWYATGDGGYLDDEGYLFLTDRIKDMIVTGGENVYPVEVEEALRKHPAVLDVAVVGMPDVRWSEIVAAVIELRSGATVTADDLIAHARAHIAGYKCPRAVHFGTLPRTASGKVQRAKVRQDLRASLK